MVVDDLQDLGKASDLIARVTRDGLSREMDALVEQEHSAGARPGRLGEALGKRREEAVVRVLHVLRGRNEIEVGRHVGDGRGDRAVRQHGCVKRSQLEPPAAVRRLASQSGGTRSLASPSASPAELAPAAAVRIHPRAESGGPDLAHRMRRLALLRGDRRAHIARRLQRDSRNLPGVAFLSK